MPIFDKIELYFVSVPLPAPFSPAWIPGLTRSTVEARDALLTEPWHHDRGWFNIPQSLGLGVEIDHDALKRLGKCFFRGDRVTRVWMPELLMAT